MAGFLDKAKNFVVDKIGSMEKPEADVLDVDLKGMSRECVTYNAKTSIKNPYSHSIPICDISYSLKSNNKEIGSGKIPDPGSLKANDETIMDIGLKVPYNVLLTLAKDIGADWDIDYELHIGLTVDLPIIGSFTIPIDNKGQIKLPTFSDLF